MSEENQQPQEPQAQPQPQVIVQQQDTFKSTFLYVFKTNKMFQILVGIALIIFFIRTDKISIPGIGSFDMKEQLQATMDSSHLADDYDEEEKAILDSLLAEEAIALENVPEEQVDSQMQASVGKIHKKVKKLRQVKEYRDAEDAYHFDPDFDPRDLLPTSGGGLTSGGEQIAK